MQEKNNEVVLFTTPLPRCAVLSPQGGQVTARGLAYFVDTPSSALRATSPARGEVNNTLCAKHPAEGEVNGGFTLIELLVVVLIIGILAAVAVPQYQFAVDKSNIAPYLTKVQELVKAEQIYFLANGEYTYWLEKLDIDFTKICPVMRGNNELAYCPGNFAITVFTSNAPASDGFIWLNFCSTTICRWNTSDPIIKIKFNMITGNIDECSNDGSARGIRLCKWLKPE